MDRLDLDPGASIFVELGRIEVNQHVPATLVGYRHGQYLVVTTPMLHGRPVAAEGEVCLLRYTGNGRLVGFSSTVLRQVDQPEPLTFLSYPTSIVERSMRRHERVGVLLPAVAAWTPEGSESHQQANGFVLDLSRSGCRFRAEIEVDQGQILRLRLRLPTMQADSALVVEGRVVRVSRAGARLDWGIEFRLNDDRLAEQIAAFVEQCERVSGCG